MVWTYLVFFYLAAHRIQQPIPKTRILNFQDFDFKKVAVCFDLVKIVFSTTPLTIALLVKDVSLSFVSRNPFDQIKLTANENSGLIVSKVVTISRDCEQNKTCGNCLCSFNYTTLESVKDLNFRLGI